MNKGFLTDRRNKPISYNFFSSDQKKIISQIGKEKLLESLRKMLLIRNFETRAEAAYLQGNIGGFFHSYIGQEAIQTSILDVFGPDNWYITTYRCHALALLLGATPNEIMAELFGRATGNAKGRGGSMHLYADRMLGGFGIVGGHIPIATGAAFTLKYQDKKNEIAICFLGDGAVAQGAFHESLNLASLWSLPCLYVIENNQWGMGTHVSRAVAAERLAEDIAPGYGIKGYTLDGLDFFNCYAGMQHIQKEMQQTGRPVLVEMVVERFKGHSISDPGLYRSKEDLKERMGRDPILIMKDALMKTKIIDEEQYKQIEKQEREIVLAALEYAEKSPWPNPIELEEDVFC